jgi:hypothetical protein
MGTQGQRLPSAMELSIHKIQRDRQMAQALIEQRQLTSNYGLNSQAPVSHHLCLCLFIMFHFNLTFVISGTSSYHCCIPN